MMATFFWPPPVYIYIHTRKVQLLHSLLRKVLSLPSLQEIKEYSFQVFLPSASRIEIYNKDAVGYHAFQKTFNVHANQLFMLKP